MSCDRENDCNGCTCHCGNPPCSHCTSDHDNVDNHPECHFCGEILYDEHEVDNLRHTVECFELT